MGWKGAVEGLSWAVVVPAVLLAVSHSDAGELALGAFGPPAATTLSRWLLVGSALAGGVAWWTRAPRMTGLSAAALLSLGTVRFQHRNVSTRDVTFDGGGITIAATIFEPRMQGRHPTVVLVPGSAPLKRGFYSMWAEHLVQSGLVVIVPDKRGVGGTGGMLERNNNSSRANLELLASDVTAALDFAARLPIVDTTRLGLFGLSQAGWVAPIAAVRSTRAHFLVFITAPTVSVREEGTWSNLRGDDERNAAVTAEVADHIMDTVRTGGVDARPILGALSIPGLWLFGANDNSIPTSKSVAVLDSLRLQGKAFESVTYPDAGHLVFTRKGRVLPYAMTSSWDAMDRWITSTIGRASGS